MARRAYELAPDMPFASLVLGSLHIWARDFAEAERWSRRAIRLGRTSTVTTASGASCRSA